MKRIKTLHETSAPADDPVLPRHYSELVPPPVDVIENWGLGFCLGNVVKYIARAGRKTPDVLTDLKKAQWYLDREITTREKRGEK